MNHPAPSPAPDPANRPSAHPVPPRRSADIHAIGSGARVRHQQALSRTRAVWRRRAGAAVPLLLAIAAAVALV
ncbi:hypothetical protein [Pseudoduganella buxea]|uniref:Uncharacterized protein n=1 Tax=Pseudoduganella buxea TaxID=1949069 RepID=A0A6I3SY67_9BURK|nr:hypothetical protein [Pseudoduganella buxea]MTV54158.1 hypothetical protein [Pseudoduganella buxea]GGC15412.1 hypothetical protein GCM10011572_40930 [Pseudoduganella buxea]